MIISMAAGAIKIRELGRKNRSGGKVGWGLREVEYIMSWRVKFKYKRVAIGMNAQIFLNTY